MPSPPFASAEYLTIQYQSDTNILVARFLRPLLETENQQAYFDLLAAARQHQSARYWLLDIRRRRRSGPLMMGWLRRDFYPRLVQELGSPVRLVYFMAPGLQAEIAADRTIPAPDAYVPDAPFRIHQSITEGEAVRWLLAEQAAEAGR